MTHALTIGQLAKATGVDIWSPRDHLALWPGR
jgi:hypothetical protein